MFDEKTSQELKYYVYALFSNNDSHPFYIGKGKGNRVFDHLKCALEDTSSESLKYETLRSSDKVKHVIVRHGLTEKEAFSVESAMIDMFRYIEQPLTNIQAGHNTIEKGLMTSDEVVRLYNAEDLEQMEDDCIAININKTYKRGNDKDTVYQATKETWVINESRIPNIRYVLSEYNSLIVEVFEVSEWYEKERAYGPTSKKAGKTRVGYGFTGKVAPTAIRNRYLNKSIKKHKKQGQANPVQFTL